MQRNLKWTAIYTTKHRFKAPRSNLKKAYPNFFMSFFSDHNMYRNSMCRYHSKTKTSQNVSFALRDFRLIVKRYHGFRTVLGFVQCELLRNEYKHNCILIVEQQQRQREASTVSGRQVSTHQLDSKATASCSLLPKATWRKSCDGSWG